MIAIGSCWNLWLLVNISNTSKEVELVWNTEPGSRARKGQNGRPEGIGVEDDRLLDHHIEEVLGTFRDATRVRETDPDPGEQRDG